MIFTRVITSLINSDAAKFVLVKNTKYVGALSKKADKTPVNQKYIDELNPEKLLE